MLLIAPLAHRALLCWLFHPSALFVKHCRHLILSGVLAAAATAAFVAAVGAARDGLLVLLFGGFWIGIHAFLGFVGLSRRLDREARLKLLSYEDYERIARDMKNPRRWTGR